jgi:hypothetical protein
MGRRTLIAAGGFALVYAPAAGFEGAPAFIKKIVTGPRIRQIP